MTQAQRIVLVVATAFLIWLAGYAAGSFAPWARAEQTAAHVASPGPAASARNLEIRGKLEEAWYAELNGTIPYPRREYLRRYRRLENRYFIWRRIEPNGLVIELSARYVHHRYFGAVIAPPKRPTIGPVRYYPGYGWGPGLGQKRPSWYTLSRSQQYHSK